MANVMLYTSYFSIWTLKFPINTKCVRRQDMLNSHYYDVPTRPQNTETTGDSLAFLHTVSTLKPPQAMLVVPVTSIVNQDTWLSAIVNRLCGRVHGNFSALLFGRFWLLQLCAVHFLKSMLSTLHNNIRQNKWQISSLLDTFFPSWQSISFWSGLHQ